jgi:hypothetical protein
MRSRSNRVPLRGLGCALVLWSLGPATVGAQSAPPPGEVDTAVLTVSASTAIDDNGTTAEAVDVRDSQYRNVQAYSLLRAAVSFTPQQERFQWQLNAATGARYYETLHQFFTTGNFVAGSVTFPLGRRTSISVSESATYSETYSVAPFLGAPDASSTLFAPLDYSVVSSPNYSTATNVSITRALTSRASLTASYGNSQMVFTEPDQPDLKSSSISGRFTYRITKYLGFHAGYGRRFGRYDLNSIVPNTAVGAPASNLFGQNANVDDIDIGLDYNRALSLKASRKTTLNFATGSAITEDYLGRHFSATGSARLDHRFGRSGRVDLEYSRSVQLLQGLIAPVFADTVTASIQHALSPRMQVSSSAGYVFGVVGSLDAGSDYDYGAWTGTGQFSFALTRRASFQSGYTYYQHRIGTAVELLGHLPNLQRQQILYVGLSYGLPLVRERARTRR